MSHTVCVPVWYVSVAVCVPVHMHILCIHILWCVSVCGAVCMMLHAEWWWYVCVGTVVCMYAIWCVVVVVVCVCVIWYKYCLQSLGCTKK